MKNKRPIQKSLLIQMIVLSIIVFSGCHAKKNVPPKLIEDSLIFVYPPEARAKHLEGKVVLRVLINKKGEVEKTRIQHSSGYDMLDETALNVAKEALFKPARIKGKVQSVWITWPLIFEISSMKFIPEEWIEKASNYHYDATSSDESKRRMAQQSLYYHYKDFASSMVEERKLFMNNTALKVVLPEVRKQWIFYEDSWPLTFILFQDYIVRYPQSEFREEAEAYLIEYIKNELFQLKVRSTTSDLPEKMKQELYQKLLSFLERNYPDSVTKELRENY